MGWFIAVVVILLVVIIPNVRIVPQATQYVIEFLGKYKCTWDAGIHVKIPFLERIANKITLKEQVMDSPPQPVITKDNVTMQIDTVVFFRIFDAKLYTYGVVNPIRALENLTATTLRNIVGEMELDGTLTSRDIINTVSRSISTDTYQPIIDALGKGEIFRNTELRGDFPMYAAGVYRGKELVMLIFLWHAGLDQRSLYYVNLFKILRDLVQMSLLRAYDYNQAVYNRQYIENTHIMKAEAFRESVAAFTALAEKKVSTFIILELECENVSYEELDKRLLPKVRANDIIGEAENGRVRLLLSQAEEKDLPFILPRFEDLGVKISVIQ